MLLVKLHLELSDGGLIVLLMSAFVHLLKFAHFLEFLGQLLLVLHLEGQLFIHKLLLVLQRVKSLKAFPKRLLDVMLHWLLQTLPKVLLELVDVKVITSRGRVRGC